VQVEKFLERYETLVAERGEAETEIGEEFLAHARAIRAERETAAKENREPNLANCSTWGGVTIAYRRRLIDAPSYTLNHEEVEKALEEGIRFAECLTPEAVEVDEYGAAKGSRWPSPASTRPESWHGRARHTAGAQHHRRRRHAAEHVLAREDPDNVVVDGKYFRAVDEDGNPVKAGALGEAGEGAVLMDLRPDGRAMSFFGDLHPSFLGNVVKAMASAKQGYPVVSRTLAKRAQRGLLRPSCCPA
jgi:hypothetical protein